MRMWLASLLALVLSTALASCAREAVQPVARTPSAQSREPAPPAFIAGSRNQPQGKPIDETGMSQRAKTSYQSDRLFDYETLEPRRHLSGAGSPIHPPAPVHMIAAHAVPAPSTQPATTQPSQGLSVTYYDNLDFTGRTVTRIDPTINFNWGSGSPDPAIAPDTFAARWTGTITPKFSETYTFHTVSDDGVRLWIDGKLVIDQWKDQPATEHTGQITLQTGQRYTLQLEFYDNFGGAQASLKWSSRSQPLEAPTKVLAGQSGGHSRQISGTPSRTPTSAAVSSLLYEATFFSEAPDLNRLGLRRAFVAYEGEFFQHGDAARLIPDEATVRDAARRASRESDLLVIDIECWPTDIRRDQMHEVDHSIHRFLQIINWIRDEAPQLKVAIYGEIVKGDYYIPVMYRQSLDPLSHDWYHRNAAKLEADYRLWQAANEKMRPLADAVDIVMPSIYTFDDGKQNWEYFAAEAIAAARAFGKPVVPFLWFEYHPNGGDAAGNEVQTELWRNQLEFTTLHADGLVIWGGGRRWNEGARWWQTTADFLRSRQ